MHELVIRNGRVARCEGWLEADIGIEGGRIAALGKGLEGRRSIDAAGLWVLPGGIDAHCHLDQPSWGGADTADDFGSGSISAAFGGTTCLVPFAMPAPGTSAVEGLERAMARSAGRSFVDYGFHGVVTPGTGGNVDRQVETLAARGVPSVKVFLTYEGFAAGDDLVLGLMDAARASRSTVLVHAENDAAIRRTRGRLLAAGRRSLRFHLVAGAMPAEREATHRVATLAEIAGARAAILHVSGRQSAEEVERARERGVAVVAETCPQYVLLDASVFDGPEREAARFLFSPPPRGADDNAFLWHALAEGRIALWSSDHSPYRLADKLPRTADASFADAVSGVPGLETRLPLLFSEGLLAGRLSLARYLELSAETAARLYGLDDRKGRIAVGLDADIALWDPAARWTVRHEDLHSNVDFSPFEGRRIRGRPVTVLLRGEPVVQDGRLVAAAPAGRFQARHRAAPDSFPIPLEEHQPWRVT
ncbi:dihydropyrimidinase [Aureimonas flava]|uniref:D-hydantoinase n=1 Tax=Aureimonas flava TaxID=2320271 RepID=A0A3A1WQ11_9HYPH|nr:dihydropyrimidinase [Aureimonas flava]RIY02833.1 dihydropyrimidinase [Aureimonas flava]